MLIDTHCHLDATEFDSDRDEVVKLAQKSGISAIVIPAIARSNFAAVSALATRLPCCVAAFGIHPLFVDHASPEDLTALSTWISEKQPVAIGEIGLDFFIPGFQRERQEFYFAEQLKIARAFDLPVLLHVRRAVDDILKYLRRIKVCGGIAHAFNGSHQQATEFIKLGFKLGFGGTMTYPRALRIRELAKSLPLDAIVLETDAPDIPPEWLGATARNSPLELPGIAQVLADLRGLEINEISTATTQNAIEIMPKLSDLFTSAKVLH